LSQNTTAAPLQCHEVVIDPTCIPQYSWYDKLQTCLALTPSPTIHMSQLAAGSACSGGVVTFIGSATKDQAVLDYIMPHAGTIPSILLDLKGTAGGTLEWINLNIRLNTSIYHNFSKPLNLGNVTQNSCVTKNSSTGMWSLMDCHNPLMKYGALCEIDRPDVPMPSKPVIQPNSANLSKRMKAGTSAKIVCKAFIGKEMMKVVLVAANNTISIIGPNARGFSFTEVSVENYHRCFRSAVIMYDRTYMLADHGTKVMCASHIENPQIPCPTSGHFCVTVGKIMIKGGGVDLKGNMVLLAAAGGAAGLVLLVIILIILKVKCKKKKGDVSSKTASIELAPVEAPPAEEHHTEEAASAVAPSEGGEEGPPDDTEVHRKSQGGTESVRSGGSAEKEVAA
ncbi:hypothetical protein RRG08_057799, partial [Elysia crispata]